MFRNLSSTFSSSFYKKQVQCLTILFVVLLFTNFNTYAIKPTNFQQPLTKNNILEINKPINQQLKPDETHSYKVDLMQGQYVKILVEQKGVDLDVTLSTLDGKLVATTDNPYGERGIEVFEAIINLSGSYTINVTSHSQVTGDYEIQLKELRIASLRDKDLVGKRFLAEATLEKGRELYAELNYQEALKVFEEALKYAQESENKEIEADALNEIGRTYSLMGNSPKAREYYQKVIDITATLSDPTAKGNFENVSAINLGEIYYYQGYYQKAFDSFKQALTGYEALKINHQIAVSASNLANCYMFFSDLPKAKELYEKALSIHEKTGDLNSQIVVLDNLGSLNYYLKNYKEAENSFLKALEINKGTNPAKANTLRNLGSKYADRGNYELAVKYLQSSLEMFQRLGNKPEEGFTLVRISQSLLLDNLKNKYKSKKIYKANNLKALEYLQQAFPLLQEDNRSAPLAEGLKASAEIKAEMGDLKDAQKDIEEAIKLTTFTQNNIGDLNLRQVYRASLQDSYDLYITLLMKQHLADPTSGYDIKAFQVSEQSRARSFLELLAQSKIDVRQGVSQDLIDKEFILKKQLDRQQIALIASEDITPKELEEIKQQQETSLRELRGLLVEIKKQSPSFVALTEPAPLELQKLQKEILDEESLLLEYFLGKNESYLWVISQEKITSYVLSKADTINNIAKTVHTLLSKNNDKTYWQTASKLSQQILPNPKELEQKRLIIVADGGLHYIPFGALPITSTSKKPTQSNLYVPLIQTNEVVNLPSASVSAFLRQIDKQQALSQNILVVADPVFSLTDSRLNPESEKQSAQSQSSLTEEEISSIVRDGSNLRRLQSSLEESKSIDKLAAGKCKVLLGTQASKDNFLAESLLDYYILHFATHGEINDKTPELSRIVLSLVNKNKEIQNGFLSLYEIYNLKLQADLVVLSGCKSALGEELKGEGIIGLTRGFLSAGSSRVVSSLWSVDDRATSKLMAIFYKKMLQENKTPSQALRLAQMEMSKEQSFKSPYFWAPFILQGRWN